MVDATHVLKQNERIVYRFHRHEPELYCSEVKVLEVTNDFVIVRKPATVPMHPIGRYVLFYIIIPNINNIQLMQFHNIFCVLHLTLPSRERGDRVPHQQHRVAALRFLNVC